MEEVVIGVDIGTSSTKAVACSPDGRVMQRLQRPHAMALPRPGWAEMDAQVWEDDLISILRELVDSLRGRPVRALSVSGMGPCLLACDGRLNPQRPAILYGIDMRSGAEIEELTSRYGSDAIVTRGGTELSTQAVGPKLLWLRRNEPDVWAVTRRWYNTNSYAVALLTGEYVLDHHTASQCDPLYDVEHHCWIEEWVSDIAPGVEMPALAWPGQVVGRVHRHAAEQTGLAVGTPVCAGTVDAWAEAYSAGVRQPGDLMLMYGSTMFFVQVTPRLVKSPGLWATCGVEPATTTLAAGMATSGSLTSWVRELAGNAPFETLVKEAAAAPPGSEGLVVLPYFAGERTPIFDPDARGVVAGLTLRHGRGHLYRAACEGIAYGIRQILGLLEACAGPPRRVVAVGGGTQGGLWTQIVSDVTGQAQIVPAQTIGASYGDALLAAEAAGLVETGTDWARDERLVEPDPNNWDLYQELFELFSQLYPATRSQVHRLARLQTASPLDPAPPLSSPPPPAEQHR